MARFMANRFSAACLVILMASVCGGWLFAQNPPSLLVSPASATMLVGDTRTFRAVGKDGRIRHSVMWRVSPEDAVTLTLNGDEATLRATQATSKVILIASVGDDTAEASIEVRSGTLAPGTALWSVPEIPGCKNRKISQAVPTANGPDLYVEEDCPQGTVIRALTADGREIWRTGTGGSGTRIPGMPASKAAAPSGERLNPNRLNLAHSSVCDAVALGMTKEKVASVVESRNLRVDEKQRQGDSWSLEEAGSRCDILFDIKSGAVVKKKKTLVTD